jgi:uncharacterized membrane protein HdeD (DUF308 family)
MKMNSNVNPQGTLAAEESAAQQLERHLAELPKSRRRAHTLLGVLMLICGTATVGLMIWAIYVSVRSNTFGLEYVPFWWFIWAAAVSLFLILYGLASVVGSADPPFDLGRSKGPMKFGRQAQREGWQMVIGGLVGILAFTALAIYVGVTGADLFEHFIKGVVIFSVGLGLIAALSGIARAILRAFRQDR